MLSLNSNFPFIQFSWPVKKKITYINKYTYFLLKITSLITPQEAHKRLVLQVYLGSNTLELSATKALLALAKQHSLLFS